ncbi:hypothetical protein PENTCL1PPCAC_14098, partial [Pristionchus entomophagus]
DKMFIAIDDASNGQVTRIIEALFSFNTDCMIVDKDPLINRLVLPQLDLSTLLNLAQNVRCFSTNATCTSLTAQDLCTLRQAMLEDNCKLKTFCALIDEATRNSFIEKC